MNSGKIISAHPYSEPDEFEAFVSDVVNKSRTKKVFYFW